MGGPSLIQVPMCSLAHIEGTARSAYRFTAPMIPGWLWLLRGSVVTLFGQDPLVPFLVMMALCIWVSKTRFSEMRAKLPKAGVRTAGKPLRERSATGEQQQCLGWDRWSELGRIVGFSPVEARSGSLLGENLKSAG